MNTPIAADGPSEPEKKPGKRSTVGPVTVFGGVGALMLLAGVIMLGADPCIKNSTVGCTPGSHTTFWAGTLTIVGFLTLFIAAWVYWFSPSPKERAVHDTSSAGIYTDAHRHTARVRAQTPQGITVTETRCCRNGHPTPDQAARHAERIQRRIERFGR